MVEVLFYQLDHQPLEAVLPQLLERTLERGWRACVQAGSAERVEALSNALWMWREEAFIPHGTERDGNGPLQPIWLTEGDDNPNGAAVRFLVDGAAAASLEGLERAVYLFDGGNPAALATARTRWSESLQAGHAVTYWQQDEDGRWVKRA